MEINIKQGDCLELMKEIPDESVDLVVTDPPYLHVKGGMKSKKFNTGTWKAESYMNEKMSDFNEPKIYEFLDNVIPKMKKVNMYIFCSKLQLVCYFKYLSEHKKLKYDLLFWNKDVKSMKSSKFHTSDVEYIVRIYESGVSLEKVWNEDKTKADVKYYLKNQCYKQPRGKHNTMKPTELIENLLLVSSKEKDIVLDPFMGSGSTGVACQKTNRNFIGFELDETYFNIAKERLDEV